MRDRGERKLLEAYNNNNNNNGDDYNYIGENYFPEFPCKKHPGSSSSLASSGICSYCLTDRLAQQLVCSQCGEQKYSNYCSCSNNNTRNMFYTNPDSSTTSADVGRISFLLENDKVDVGGGGNGAEITRSRSIIERRAVDNNHDDYSTHQLRRSNSISTAAGNNNKKNNNNNNKHNNNNNYNNNNVSRAESGKLWKRLFRKKRDKNSHNFNSSSNNNNNNQNEESNECNGVSRSRSLSSFNRFYDTDQDNGGFAVSSSAARASSVSTGNAVMDSAKISCFSESEARMSNFDYCDAFNFIGPNKSNIFSLRETEFVNSDDHAFIDLKLHDMSSGSSRVPPDLAAMKSGFGFSTKEVGYRGGGGGDGVGHDMFGNNDGRSYRNSSFSERELRKCKKSYKVWKWFFKHQENSGKFGDDNYAFNS